MSQKVLAQVAQIRLGESSTSSLVESSKTIENQTYCCYQPRFLGFFFQALPYQICAGLPFFVRASRFERSTNNKGNLQHPVLIAISVCIKPVDAGF